MKFKTFVIFAGSGGWRIGRGPLRETIEMNAGADNAQIAEAISAALKRIDYVDENVIFALASEKCLAASVDATALPRKGAAATLLYRMEEQLPIAAEDVTADFIISGDRALGICVVNKQVTGILEELEKRRINVTSIMPASLLALTEIHEELGDGTAAVIWEEHGRINIIQLKNRRPVQWTLLPGDPEAIQRQLRVLAMEAEGSTDVWAVASEPVLNAVRSVDGITLLTRRDLAFDDAVVLGAQRFQTGEAVPLVELRRDALGMNDPLHQVRTPLDALLASAVLLMLVITLVMMIRTSYYRSAERENLDAQAAIWSEFSKAEVPDNIRATLESEYRKTTSTTGANAGVPTASALQMLHGVLSAIPEDVEFEFERMEFTDTAFAVDGTVPTYVEPGDIGIAISEKTRMSVGLPNAQRTDDGWSFTLRGQKDDRKPAVAAR